MYNDLLLNFQNRIDIIISMGVSGRLTTKQVFKAVKREAKTYKRIYRKINETPKPNTTVQSPEPGTDGLQSSWPTDGTV